MAGMTEETFNYGDYFFWIPMVVPYFGGIAGGAVYSAFVSWHYLSFVDLVEEFKAEEVEEVVEPEEDLKAV